MQRTAQVALSKARRMCRMHCSKGQVAGQEIRVNHCPWASSCSNSCLSLALLLIRVDKASTSDKPCSHMLQQVIYLVTCMTVGAQRSNGHNMVRRHLDRKICRAVWSWRNAANCAVSSQAICPPS